jgi:hypothetical protein
MNTDFTAYIISVQNACRGHISDFLSGATNVVYRFHRLALRSGAVQTSCYVQNWIVFINLSNN